MRVVKDFKLQASIREKFKPKALSSEEIEESKGWIIKDGVFTQLTESLTAGPIVVALALLMGASNALIGYLLALPFLCNAFGLPGVYFFEKLRLRKPIVVASIFFSRIGFLGVALLAFFPSIPGAVYILATLYTIRYLGSGFISSGWNSWMKDIVPASKLGAFFSKRLMLMVGCGLLANLAAAFLLDVWILPQHYFYGIIVLVAVMFSMMDVYSLYRVYEPPMENAHQDEKFLKKFLKVFKDKNYMRLVSFLATFNFAINLAVPFFSVYVLNRLEYSLSFSLILMTVMQVTNISVMRIWGVLADRFSNKSILSVAGPMYVLSIFLFLFTNFPDKHMLTIPLLYFIYALAGMAQAGVTLGVNNIALKLADKGLAPVYLSVNGTMTAMMSGIAPIIGGMFADFFAGKELSLSLHWKTAAQDVEMYVFGMQYWDFFFFFAAIIGMLSLGLLKQVREEGEVHERIIMSSFVSSLFRNLSATYMMPQKLFIYFAQKKPKEDKKNFIQETDGHNGGIKTVANWDDDFER